MAAQVIRDATEAEQKLYDFIEDRVDEVGEGVYVAEAANAIFNYFLNTWPKVQADWYRKQYETEDGSPF